MISTDEPCCTKLDHLNGMDFALLIRFQYRAGILELWTDEAHVGDLFCIGLQLQRQRRRRSRVRFALHTTMNIVRPWQVVVESHSQVGIALDVLQGRVVHAVVKEKRHFLWVMDMA